MAKTETPGKPGKSSGKAPAASDKRAAGAGADDDASPRAARVVQKREFIDRVVEASGGKKGQVKPIIEATLDQLGRALAAGETLVVNPFGRARVSVRKGLQNGGEVINLRLRRSGNDGTDDED